MIYTKPVLLRNEDMAEGVYAASGDGQPSIEVVFTGNFGMEPKQTRFNILLSGDLGARVEVQLEFDREITRMDCHKAESIIGTTIIIPNPESVHWLHVEEGHNIKCTKATVRTIQQTWNQT